MYRKILAPMDGSSLAECILNHVKEIAEGCGTAEVDFLFVADLNRGESDTQGLTGTGGESALSAELAKVDQAQYAWGQNYCNYLVAEMKKGGMEAKAFVMTGRPADVILDFAVKNNNDLIIISAYGHSGLSRFAMGSVTDKVVRTAAVPVIVVPPAGCRVTV